MATHKGRNLLQYSTYQNKGNLLVWLSFVVAGLTTQRLTKHLDQTRYVNLLGEN